MPSIVIEQVHYRINYSANGGSGAPPATTGTVYDWPFEGYVYVTLASGTPTRSGYTFLGWAASSGATSASWSAGGSYSFQATSTSYSVTLYAVWKANTYNVVFKPGANGTGSQTYLVKTHNVGLKLKGAIFTRTGYEMLGWSTTDGGSKQYDLEGWYYTNASTNMFPVWGLKRSTLSASNGTIGISQTLTVTRYNNSLTHTITYSCGSASGTIVTKSSSLSIPWTPPVELAEQITSSASGSCTLTISTYNGNTLVGSLNTSITLSVPDSYKITISNVLIEEAVEGLATKFGAYVQSASKFKITTSTNNSNSHGSTLLSITVVLEGDVTSQTLSGSPVISNVIQSSGDISYTVTIKDSRGRTDTTSGTISVLSYDTPVGAVTALRNASNGDAIVVYAYDINSLNNHNDKTIVVKYKTRNDVNWTTFTTITPDDYSGSGTVTITGLLQVNSYDILVEIKDYFTSTEVSDIAFATGKRVLDIWPNGGIEIYNRRVYGTLSSAGWYRVMKFSATSQSDADGFAGSSIDFFIGTYGSGNETHRITLNILDGANVFKSEVSESYSNNISVTKIRLTRYTDGNDYICYVDIYYNQTYSKDIYVDFEVHDRPERKGLYDSESLQSVDASPAGEIIRSQYTFGYRNTIFIEMTPAVLTLASGTWKTVCSITLPRGSWLVFFTIRFQSNSTGRRYALLSRSQDSSSGYSIQSSHSVAPVNGSYTHAKAVEFIHANSEETWYVNAYQNSGSSLEIGPRVSAIKLD